MRSHFRLRDSTSAFVPDTASGNGSRRERTEALLAALASLERAAELQPRNATVLTAYAHLVERARGNRTEAALLYRRAALAEPSRLVPDAQATRP